MLNLATALYFIRQKYRSFKGELFIASDTNGVHLTVRKNGYPAFLEIHLTWEEIQEWLEKLEHAL